MKNGIEAHERLDLNSCTDEYESIWIELVNKRLKNVIIACTYRHLHNKNINEFTTYMTKCINKLNKEKKEVYVTGDFNLDLLKYETNSLIHEFYDMMTSSGFLPLILQPTRIQLND